MAASPTVESLLQWGRDNEVAEMAVTGGTGAGATLLQWGRDNEVAEIDGLFPRPFGAGALQWGRDNEVAEIVPEPGRLSNAPRPLQWGRDNEVAEMAGVAVGLNDAVASMGPRQ